jgi:hypothetical protein
MPPSFLDRCKLRLHAKDLVILPLILTAMISVGCGGMSSGTPAQSAHTQLNISPLGLVLASGSKQQFIATVMNTSSTAVAWSASSGTITNGGLFTAPVVTSKTRVEVSARSLTDKSSTAVSILTIESDPPKSDPPLHINTNEVPGGVVGVPYALTVSADGGLLPYRWSLQGSLPQGLSFDTASGSISGTPTTMGSFPIQVVVADAHSQTATQSLSLAMAHAYSSGSHDGPAELPRVYIQSALVATPAPGSVIPVPAGENLQAALDKASCGDTIELQAGATYTGVFTLPAKNCDDNHWIILRTNAPDSALPKEGTRVTPCYAGVSSLAGRPRLNCSSTANVLAKLMMTAAGGPGPIQFTSGANHYRLLGLEITRQLGGPVVFNLASVQSDGTMDHLVFDRVWMHGTPQDDTTRGIALGGSTYVSIVDSYFTDFHCVSATGSCSDAQAILGGLGSHPMGPYKIVNNFLEASAENILFGGGAATVTPADIEIRHNHMFKPLTWMKGQSGYVGGTNGNPFVVKNLFELKNAQRVLVDGNTMENTWGGFSQAGFAILLTPKNQNSDSGNLCPNCQVTDVTIRNLKISHVGAGMQIANALDGVGKPLDGERYSIHDVIIDDIDGVKYNGPSEFAQVSTGKGIAALNNVTIDHVTAFPSSTLFIIGDQTATTAKMKSFVFTNSIVNAGSYPVWSTGSGGQANCAVHDSPLITFNACFSSYSFAGNAIVAPPSSTPAAKWPSGNFFPTAAAAVAFVNYNGGNGGDYHLQASSRYKHLGTDGKDLGADVDAVMLATAGVE